MRTRLPVRLLLACLLVAALAVAALAWWMWPRQPGTLEPGWEAVVKVLAGDGVSGYRDGEPGRARFSDPFGIAVAADGTVYVADAGNAQRIRRVSSSGVVSTLAGGVRGYADGPAATARFDTPSGVAVGQAGEVYVADTGNNAIRRIGLDGTVTTVAGGGPAGYADGVGRDARFNGPIGIAVDGAGRVIVADTYNDRIRAIEPGGHVVTIAGAGIPGSEDGYLTTARFHTPCGVAVDAAGNILVADTGSGAARMISPSGIVSTLSLWPLDSLVRPIGIASGGTGLVYVTDDRGRIVELDAKAGARVLAGSRPGFEDGPGAAARFRGLAGIAAAGEGRLLVADSRNAFIRIVAARRALVFRAPVPPVAAPGFVENATATPPLVWPLAPMSGPFEITGTIGEPRGGEGSERLHAGLDVYAFEGTPVIASRDGVVSEPAGATGFGSLNESIRVGPLAYVHIRAGRTRAGELLDTTRFVPTYDEAGQLALIRLKRGSRFRTGEPVGTANAFNHVHLNIGWPGEEHNPLHFRLTQFEDTIPPTIARGGIRLFGEDAMPLKERRKGRLLVAGRIQVVVDAYDQVDGNAKRRKLGLYRLGYQVLNRDGSPVPGFEAPLETMRFDRLGPDADPRLIFASGSGIPFYGGRTTRMLYVVTNSFRDGVASAGSWDASALPPGDYIVRILAADIHGNEAVANRDVLVTVAAAPG